MLKSLRTLSLSRYAMNNVYFFSSKTEAPDLGLKKKKRVGDDNIRVTLISGTDDISILSFAEAQKISKRRDLKLVKVIDFDTKTKRPVYKLMSPSEYHEEEVKKRAEKKEAKKQPHLKSEKLLQINSNFGKHDIENKLKNLNKWLIKYHEVRAILTTEGKPFSTIEEIFNQIQESVKEIGSVNQKHIIKNTSIKFHIKPNIEAIELLKQDPDFEKNYGHKADDVTEDLVDDEEEDVETKVIEVNVAEAKQSSFVSKT